MNQNVEARIDTTGEGRYRDFMNILPSYVFLSRRVHPGDGFSLFHAVRASRRGLRFRACGARVRIPNFRDFGGEVISDLPLGVRTLRRSQGR